MTDVSELSEEGWFGNPTWATPERAETFVDDVASEVLTLVESVIAAHRGR